MKTGHTFVCMCVRCEQSGTGAFGAMPDGSPGLVVVKRRRRRRRRRERRGKAAA